MTSIDLNSSQSPALGWVFGDSVPWVQYVAEAWQQAAAPTMYTGPSRRPADAAAEVETSIAYWSPLLHLTTFALGWKIPELGLLRWLKMGAPTKDPVLATIDSRYGPEGVEMFATWLSVSGGRLLRQNMFGEVRPGDWSLPTELSRIVEKRRSSPEYQHIFGSGGDQFHLTTHLGMTGGDKKPQRRKMKVAMGGESVDFVLIGEQYRPLFNSLREGLVPQQTVGRSSRVGLVCPSIGWLGNYRCSRDTGLWFRGQHRWHTLGNDGSS